MEYLFHRNIKIPLIGFGTYKSGVYAENFEQEAQTFLAGIEQYGMRLIDTAEMYDNGKSERFVSKVIKNCERTSLFIVDKILPENARKGLYKECCENSLKRLGTDYIDLYLLHWRGGVDLQDMVRQMDSLVKEGLIKHWGVSNFDVADMEQLFACKGGNNCFCNQVLYNLSARGIEYDLLPWCKKNDVLVMAYSPLHNNREERCVITENRIVKEVCADEKKSPESLALSFVIRNKDIATVFKTSSVQHLDNNMLNVFEAVSDVNLEKLSAEFKAPHKKCELKKI